MKKQRLTGMIYMIAMCLAVLFAGVIRNHLSDVSVFWSRIESASVYVIYAGVIIGWGFSIGMRIIHRQIRRYLQFSAGLMMFWVVIRTIRFNILQWSWGDGAVSRFFWYMYYIPMLFLPLCSLYAALCLGERVKKPSSSVRWHTAIPTFALLAGVLTNEFHYQAFSFPFGFTDKYYTHGWLYYLVFLWIVALMVATLIIVYRRSQLKSAKERIWVPGFIILIGIIWSIGYINPQTSWFFGYIEISIGLSLLLVLLWESCIQIGLIASNSGFGDLFRGSDLAAEITDTAGNVFYVSGTPISDPMLAHSLLPGERALSYDDKQLVCAAIPGGHIVWEEDVSELRRRYATLEELKEQLKHDNEMLSEENALKERRTRVSTESALYGRISEELAGEISGMENLLKSSIPTHEILRRCCLSGVYMKRKSNLMLLTWGGSPVSAEELGFYLREAGDALRIMGIENSLRVEETLMLEPAVVLSFVDVCHDVMRAAMGCASSILMRMRTDGEFQEIRMVLDGAYEQRLSILTKHPVLSVRYRYEDDSYYVFIRGRGRRER